MYRIKSDSAVTSLLQYAKDYTARLSRKQKMAFFCSFIRYSLDCGDTMAAAKGIERLLSMNHEFKESLRIANKTYTEEEGERVDLLFRYAYRNGVRKRR